MGMCVIVSGMCNKMIMGTILRKKSKIKEVRRSKLTVEWLRTPVPAALGSEQAGFLPSISLNRSVLVVDNSATVSTNATSI